MLAFYLTILDTPEEKTLFEKIYLESSTPMFNLAMNILNDTYLAEDAVQDAFLSLAKKFFAFSEKSCPEIKAYLVIICRNTAIDLYNQRKSNPTVRLSDVEIPSMDNIELNAEIHYEAKEVFDAIKQPDRKYSDVLVLRLYYDLSFKEIAQIMEAPEETVRVRFFRGKAKIKNILNERKDELNDRK